MGRNEEVAEKMLSEAMKCKGYLQSHIDAAKAMTNTIVWKWQHAKDGYHKAYDSRVLRGPS